jgi:hypothetical protein
MKKVPQNSKINFAAKKMDMNNCRKTAIKSFAEVGKN